MTDASAPDSQEEDRLVISSQSPDLAAPVAHAPGQPYNTRDKDSNIAVTLPGVVDPGRAGSGQGDPLHLGQKVYQDVPEVSPDTPVWQQVLAGISGIVIIALICMIVTCLAGGRR